MSSPFEADPDPVVGEQGKFRRRSLRRASAVEKSAEEEVSKKSAEEEINGAIEGLQRPFGSMAEHGSHGVEGPTLQQHIWRNLPVNISTERKRNAEDEIEKAVSAKKQNHYT